MDLRSEADGILAKYPKERSRSAILPLLHLVQERDGHVTSSGMREVAEILGLTAAEVASVATFYTMLHLKPKGRRLVSVCHNLACSLAGAEAVIAGLEEHLATECGQTSADGEFTLERVECLAACDLAPMLQIDYDEMIGPLTPGDAVALVDRLKGGAPVTGRPAAAAAPLPVEAEAVKSDEVQVTEVQVTENAAPKPEDARPPRRMVPTGSARPQQEAARAGGGDLFEPDVTPFIGDATPSVDSPADHAGVEESARARDQVADPTQQPGGDGSS